MWYKLSQSSSKPVQFLSTRGQQIVAERTKAKHLKVTPNKCKPKGQESTREVLAYKTKTVKSQGIY